MSQVQRRCTLNGRARSHSTTRFADENLRACATHRLHSADTRANVASHAHVRGIQCERFAMAKVSVIDVPPALRRGRATSNARVRLGMTSPCLGTDRSPSSWQDDGIVTLFHRHGHQSTAAELTARTEVVGVHGALHGPSLRLGGRSTGRISSKVSLGLAEVRRDDDPTDRQLPRRSSHVPTRRCEVMLTRVAQRETRVYRTSATPRTTPPHLSLTESRAIITFSRKPPPGGSSRHDGGRCCSRDSSGSKVQIAPARS